ncbi:hypothetical protein GGI15_003386 [Coemansia interrupta]|uniref:N-acetyltransferase domain-containing protein n=1 Tax=Coemansia interrupta TaxID=1126814 RepID=A0A9W8LHN4_9FUNG|nr:hypothetical protein GGI15_003386 [Coemansia interrupta]
MVHRYRSTLPRWYAESKFLQSEAQSMVSDSTENYTFGHMFKTPTNSSYRDGNHLKINFCHLEFPWDCSGVLSDPPRNIAQIVKQIYATISSEQDGEIVPRCLVDCTLKDGGQVDEVIEGFRQAGFGCGEKMVDQVMCLETSEVRGRADGKVRRVGADSLGRLVECNARSFGYDESGDTHWLGDKLERQVRQSRHFAVYAIGEDEADGGPHGTIDAFAVVFTPYEKARDLAYVQVMGTRPDKRRRGLATRVLSHALASLPSSVERVYLEAFDQGAIAMYEKLGFHKVGTTTTAECTL